MFTGIWPALITPFRDGAVDHPALARLVRRFVDAGVAQLIANELRLPMLPAAQQTLGLLTRELEALEAAFPVPAGAL
jgi:4-hydroxy-tetrahydrodipicolinate synthase